MANPDKQWGQQGKNDAEIRNPLANPAKEKKGIPTKPKMRVLTLPMSRPINRLPTMKLRTRREIWANVV
jgi:hypothetical protein